MVDHLKAVNRIWEIILGTVLTFVSLFLVGMAGLGYWVQYDHPNVAAIIVCTVFLAVGGFCFPLSWRLITGKGRKGDGGLFSPTALRLGGLMFLAGSVLGIVVHSWSIGVVLALLDWAAAGACFKLAGRRETSSKESPGGAS